MSFFKAQQYDCLKLYLVSLSNAILVNLMAFFTCKQDFKSWIWSLSLDDVERLASIHIKESSEISH